MGETILRNQLDGWQQDRAACRVAGLKKPHLVPGLHTKVSQPIWLYPHQGKRGWQAGMCCQLVLPCGWCGPKEIPWGKAGERKSGLTWAGCRHRLCRDPEMSGTSIHMEPELHRSVRIYCQSPSGEDRLEKRPGAAWNPILPSWRDPSPTVNSVSVQNGSSSVYKINKWTSS